VVSIRRTFVGSFLFFSVGFFSVGLAFLLLACGGDSPTPNASPQSEERLFYLDEAGLYETTGGERTVIVQPAPRDFIFDAAISREGTHVALSVQMEPIQTANGYDFGVDLYTGQQGGEVRPLVTHSRIGESMVRPNWLPGGKEIIFSAFGRNASGAADLRIERVNTDTGARTRLIDNATEPSLSPDAGTLAYVAIDQTTGDELITLRDLASGKDRPLLPPTQVMANPGNIAWSHDGTRIAFAAADPISLALPPIGAPPASMHPNLRDVWVVNVDGSGLKRLTDLADGTLALAWSLDGTSIYALGDTGFWRVNSTTGVHTQIGDPVLTGRVQVLPSNP
jgi:hypothetical protein